MNLRQLRFQFAQIGTLAEDVVKSEKSVTAVITGFDDVVLVVCTGSAPSASASGSRKRTLSGDRTRALSGNRTRALSGNRIRALSGNRITCSFWKSYTCSFLRRNMLL